MSKYCRTEDACSQYQPPILLGRRAGVVPPQVGEAEYACPALRQVAQPLARARQPAPPGSL